jgi:hypothetical protein
MLRMVLSFVVLSCAFAEVRSPNVTQQAELALRFDKALALTRPDGPDSFGELVQTKCRVKDEQENLVSCQFVFDGGKNHTYLTVISVQVSNLDAGFYADYTKSIKVSSRPKK